jgi:hypothetical protein
MTRWPVMTALLLCSALPAGAAAQGFRGVATTTVRSIEIRPLQLDTVPREEATQLPDGSFELDGIPLTCPPGLPCTYYRALDSRRATLLSQDVSLTAWGLGWTGVSATFALRARADLGGEFEWPRSDDAFDAILAYAELNRDQWRVRLGRQRTSGGLGFSGFDGASVLYEPIARTYVEAYGGRSLARGLYEPRHEALQGIDDFVRDQNAYLIGIAAEAEPWTGTRVAARYQREIWSDRSALLSERASFDFASNALAPVSIDGSADYDFAFGRIGKMHVTARSQVPFAPTITVEATGRRYLPYFELWTIWGYFNPVAYHEVELRASGGIAAAAVTAFGSYRAYEPHDAPVVFGGISDDAFRLGASARMTLPGGVVVDGGYTVERGFGAYLSTGDVTAGWTPRERITVTVNGTASQQIEEFRLGEGMVWGGGGAIDLTIGASSGVAVGLDVYRQTFDNRPGQPDWNQMRGWAVFRLGFGRDPGTAERD